MILLRGEDAGELFSLETVINLRAHKKELEFDTVDVRLDICRQNEKEDKPRISEFLRHVHECLKTRWVLQRLSPTWPVLQGDPYGHGMVFVDIKFTIPSQYWLLILKRSFHRAVNKNYSTTIWITLYTGSKLLGWH